MSYKVGDQKRERIYGVVLERSRWMRRSSQLPHLAVVTRHDFVDFGHFRAGCHILKQESSSYKLDV